MKTLRNTKTVLVLLLLITSFSCNAQQLQLTNQVELYNSFKAERQSYYNRITNKSIDRYIQNFPNTTESDLMMHTFKRYIAGWTNRVNHFIGKTTTNPNNVNC